MHYEPEATLRYFSELFDDQVHNIKSISKALRTEQYLVVKEHPQQYGMLLTKRFRALKKDYPNVIYLPAEIQSEDVIKGSESIVSLTSSAAWEAIILGKPVISLGKMFWDNYPLLRKANSFKELREIIRKSDYLFPNDKITVLYISYLIAKHTELGTPFNFYNTFEKENIANVILSVEKRLLV